MNPDDARGLGIENGDYVWVDASGEDRPYIGWKPDDPGPQRVRSLAHALVGSPAT